MRLSSPINKTPHRSKQSKSNTHSDIYWACWDHEWGGGDLTGLACHCKCVSDVVSHLDLSLSLSLSLLLQTVYAEIPNQVAGLSHSWIWTVLFGDHGRYLDLFVDLFVMNWEFIDFIEWLMVDLPAKCVISCMWWLIFSPGYCSVHIYIYVYAYMIRRVALDSGYIYMYSWNQKYSTPWYFPKSYWNTMRTGSWILIQLLDPSLKWRMLTWYSFTTDLL